MSFIVRLKKETLSWSHKYEAGAIDMTRFRNSATTSRGLFFYLFFLSILFPQISQAAISNKLLLDFEWQGISLGLSAAELHEKLKSDGYTVANTQVDDKRNRTISTYKRTSDSGTFQVKISEREGLIFKIVYSERRQGKTSALEEQAIVDLYKSFQQGLGIDKSNCKVGKKAGGKCKESHESASHKNDVSFKVAARSVNFSIASRPLDAATIAYNDAFVAALKPAYSCYTGVDIQDKNALYQCIQKSYGIFTDLGAQKNRISVNHRIINLNNPALTCSDLSDFFHIARFFSVTPYANQQEYRSLYYQTIKSARSGANRNNESESAFQGDTPIPDCGTFAKVIELSIGRPPYWSQCIGSGDGDDFFHNCIAGVAPVLVNNARLTLPSCSEFQRAYRNGVSSAQATSVNSDSIVVDDCKTVMTAAKRARGPLPKFLQACDNYVAEQSTQHLQACVSSDRELLLLTRCQDVRKAYERKLIMANGYRPDGYIPITCEQAAPILVDANAARERKRIEAEKRALAIAERRRQMEQAQREYVARIQASMDARYADTPEGAAARTSVLEKQIGRNGGKAPAGCTDRNYNDLYCPPTTEEIRLAMMRRHVDKTGFDHINGYLLHGQQSTALTLLFAMGGQPGRASIGIELQYEDARLLQKCEREEHFYNCYFQLPIKIRYDQLTQESMDGFESAFGGSSAFSFNDMFFALMDSAGATEDFYYEFRLGPSGLWQARPTMEQILENMQSEIRSLR